MNFRSILAGILLVASAAASWLLIQSMNRGAPDSSTAASASQGYYLKGAAILGTNAEGGLLYRVQAQEIRQVPREKRVALTDVLVRYSADGQPTWSATSRVGSIDDESATISLSGKVRLQNDASQAKSDYLIETETLEFSPRERFARTDAEVRITQPGVMLTAVGMDADLENEILNLKAKVSGKFSP